MLLYKGFGNFALLCHVNVVYSFYSSGFKIFILLLIYWSILWLEVICMNRSLYPIQDEIIISYCSIVKWFFLWCCAYVPTFFQTVIFYWTSKYIPITQNNEQEIEKVAKYRKVFSRLSHLHQNLINIWQMSWQTDSAIHSQIIHPMEKFISLNLFKIL